MKHLFMLISISIRVDIRDNDGARGGVVITRENDRALRTELAKGVLIRRTGHLIHTTTMLARLIKVYHQDDNSLITGKGSGWSRGNTDYYCFNRNDERLPFCITILIIINGLR